MVVNTQSENVVVKHYPYIEPSVSQRQASFGGHVRALLTAQNKGLTGKVFSSLKRRRDPA